MWVARLNTKYNKFADYIISRNKMRIRSFEIPSTKEIMQDYFMEADTIILNKEEVENNLGITLNGLEQIEI